MLAPTLHAQTGAAPESARAALAAATDEPAGPGWTLPPLLLNGTLGLDLRSDRQDLAPARQQRLFTATLGGATYLYAPWLAVLNGTVGLTRGTVHSTDPEVAGESSQFVTGKLQLSMFPRSRFPAELRYEVSDSRVDASLGSGLDYRSRTFGVTQRYRPADGEFSVSASYERRVQDSPDFGQDSQDSLLADFSSRWKRHQFSASLSRSMNRRGSTGEETDFLSLIGRHSATWAPALSLESTVNWVHTGDQLIAGDRSLTMAQASSLAVWRSEAMPLTLTGSVRALSVQGDGGGAGGNLAAGVGATYEFNRSLRLNASLTATRFDGQTALSSVGALSGAYQGDQRDWGGVQWSWNGSASLGAARTDARSETGLSTQLGHLLSRAWVTGVSTWSVSLSQNASVALANRTQQPNEPTSADGLTRALTQTLAFSWSLPGTQGNAFGRLSLADARQYDAEQAHFRLFNFQLSGTHELDRRRSWTGDLTLQRAAQQSLPIPLAEGTALPALHETHQSASGELTWRHLAMFDVPRLNFSSRLRLALNSQLQTEALVPLPQRETLAWENRLDYRVGRLDSSLSLRWSRVDQRRFTLLMWRLQRSFGG
ncbi:MAG: hypothetical protein IPP44_18000 [Ideonella sp.]|nr:hypothetical protein [Ideonella sp.]